jgi:uncharacterized protein
MVLAKKRKSPNRRKSPGSRRPLAALLLIILLILLSFYLLETTRHRAAEKTAGKPLLNERQKMPSRPVEQHPAEHAVYSAAVAPLPRAKAKPRLIGTGNVAIIVDDMGSSMEEARALLAIGLPVTFSIIPGLAKAREVAEAVHDRGGEVMIHMPMEPKGYPQQRMEKNGLLLAESNEEIEAKVNGYLLAIPYAVGANNHMGSRFTESQGKMQPVLQLLKGREMFFIDSRTSPASVGYSLARKMGLRAETRQVFLDNVQDVAAIKVQLRQLAETAIKRGSAIAICHPHPTTIRALTSTLPVMKNEGITFVYASQLVH